MNAARDLAAIGTPGPWRHGSWLYREVRAGENGFLVAEAHNDGWSDDERDHRDGDATKIVRAVNALPAIADLLDTIDAAIEGADVWGTCGHEWADLKKFATARDAVAAALTGEES